MSGLRVLVVEDEPAILSGVCDVLAFHGFEPTGVDDGALGLKEALTGTYHLVILDVMLPNVDGLTICRKIREAYCKQAILMLTARGTEADVLEGFGCGADDYIGKPFSIPQLVARVQALCRRAGATTRNPRAVGGIVVDPGKLNAVGGLGSCDLSPREVSLLFYLADRPGVAVSREELLHEVWGFERTAAVETRCVDMQIVKLRRKLGRVTDAAVIETVRGAGYRVCSGADVG